MAGVLLERLLAHRSLPGGHALLVVLQGLVGGFCVLGQQHVGVGTVGRYFQGLAGQPNLFAAGGLEGLVHHLLDTIQRGLCLRLITQAGRYLPHHPFHGTPVGQHRLLGILFFVAFLDSWLSFLSHGPGPFRGLRMWTILPSGWRSEHGRRVDWHLGRDPVHFQPPPAFRIGFDHGRFQGSLQAVQYLPVPPAPASTDGEDPRSQSHERARPA